MDKDLNLNSIVSFKGGAREMQSDYLMKLERGEVDGYSSYFNLVAKRGQPEMTCLVALHR